MLSPDNGDWSAQNIGRILSTREPFAPISSSKLNSTISSQNFVVSLENEKAVWNLLRQNCQSLLRNHFLSFNEKFIARFEALWKEKNDPNLGLLRNAQLLRKELKALLQQCVNWSDPSRV